VNLALAATAGAAPIPAPYADRLRKAVVSIRVSGQDFNYKQPWQKAAPTSRFANGLVVDGRRILVTGNNVVNATLIEVQKLGEEQRYTAKLRLVDYEAPLALVEVEDASFWKDLAPINIAEMAPREGEMTVHRWLDSGQFESARAQLRQVRTGDHYPASVDLLTLDLSSPIQNAGWSEVVVADGEVVGLTTSKSGDQLIAIASPVLRQFLAATARGPYRGFARHGFTWQKLLNPALRAQLGLKPDEGGILVNRVLPHGSAAGALEPGDVVLELAGAKIDASGKYLHPRYGKLFFGVLLTDGRAPEDTVDLKVVRKGERKTVKMTLKRMLPEENKVPGYQFDTPPAYLVKAGLVFQELTVPYLQTYGDWRRRAPIRVLIAFEEEAAWPTAEAPRFVMLTQVLPDPANLGYQDLRDLIVTAVNGVRIGRLDEVGPAFEKPQGGFHVIDLLPGQRAQRIVLDAAEVQAADTRVAALYGLDGGK
jgi:S1-C subfamily serine protease